MLTFFFSSFYVTGECQKFFTPMVSQNLMASYSGGQGVLITVIDT